jgi:MHS family proline/betaine transporter-like MFS transporter
MFAISKKIIIGGAIGNALDMYDYMTWGLFSAYLSKEFLPPGSNLSDIFLLFLLTYILRPIGGLIGGIFADKIGRKKVLTLSILFMGAGTGIIGILPSYERIGTLAIIFLVFAQLIQVLTAANEYISSVSLLIESCDKRNKGYFGSWAAFGVNAGSLIASLMGAFIVHLMDAHILPEWGWRFAFIFAFFTMVVGVWIRNSIPESFEFVIENARTREKTFFEHLKDTPKTLKNHFLESILIFFLVAFGIAVTMLVFVYAPILMASHNISDTQSFIVNSSSLTLLMFLIPFFGFISDRYGREKTLSTGIFFFLLLIIPYFNFLSTGTFFQLLCWHIVIGIPCGCIFSITPVFITEIIPLSVRCSIANLVYSLASVIGGGLTPFLAIKLSADTSYSSGFILIVLGFISLMLLSFFRRKSKSTHYKLVLLDGG